MKEGLVFFEGTEGNEKSWFKTSFSEVKMEEGADIEFLRKNGQKRPYLFFNIVHFHAQIDHFGVIFAKTCMLHAHVCQKQFASSACANSTERLRHHKRVTNKFQNNKREKLRNFGQKIVDGDRLKNTSVMNRFQFAKLNLKNALFA